MDTQKMEIVKQEVSQLLYDNQEIKIESSEEYTKAGDILKVVMSKIKKLDKKRKEYTEPLEKSKKLIIADFKTVSEPLEEFVEETKSKMVEWKTFEQMQADKLQKRIEADALAQAEEEGVSEVEVAIVNDVKTERGEVSTSSVVKKWQHEVEDETKVPVEYMSVDEKKLKQAVKDGIRDIPGVRIFEKSSITIR